MNDFNEQKQIPDQRSVPEAPIESDLPIARSGRGWTIALVASSAVLVLMAGFIFGMMAERNVFSGGGIMIAGRHYLANDSSSGDFNDLKEVHKLIEDEYYYLPEDPAERVAFEKKLEFDAIQGMTSGLEDHYTAFLPPAQQAPVAEQMSGEYNGIGVWVDFPDGRFRVISPMPGSPAEAAGIKRGDVILKADGHPLTGIGEDVALELLRGPAGTTVRLTIQRPGVEQPLAIDVVRQKITTPAVFYTLLSDSKTAVIQVTVFGDKTTEQLDDALKHAREDGATGIVLDLRNNGGGWVQSAQEMIGRFVPSEKGVALYEDTDPSDQNLDSEPILAGKVSEYHLPMVVLVNGGTASASEIVAGALRDYGRAEIIGEKSFGKGSVQHVHDFADGSSARITFAQWLTPAKHIIQGAGLKPDIFVVAQGDNQSNDAQLNAAVDVLHGRTVPLDGLPALWQ
ncbi:MAG: S41 family peptidase [Thermomicrobiales bacterium]